MYDPKTLLTSVDPLLKNDGYVVKSIPNIANLHSGLKLLFGLRNYTVSGITDQSHIRFVTLSMIINC